MLLSNLIFFKKKKTKHKENDEKWRISLQTLKVYCNIITVYIPCSPISFPYRSSGSEELYKKDFSKNFDKFTLFNEVASWRRANLLKRAPAQVFSCEFCKVLKDNFFRSTSGWLCSYLLCLTKNNLIWFLHFKGNKKKFFAYRVSSRTHLRCYLKASAAT